MLDSKTCPRFQRGSCMVPGLLLKRFSEGVYLTEGCATAKNLSFINRLLRSREGREGGER